MTACDACLRRTWLLARLAGHLELARRGGGARRRLRACSRSTDAALARGAGRRRGAAGRARARARSTRRACGTPRRGRGLALVCRHDDAYPERLRDLDDAPAVLHVAGDPVGWPGSSAARGRRRAGRGGRRHAARLGGGPGGRPRARPRPGRGRHHRGQRHGPRRRQRRPRRRARGRRADRGGAGRRCGPRLAARASARCTGELAARHCVLSELPPGFAPHAGASRRATGRSPALARGHRRRRGRGALRAR